MKYLFFLLLFVSLNSMGQDSTKSIIPDTSKVTWTKVYNDVKGALSGFASALKTSSEHVYSVMVKQQCVISITWLIVMVLIIIPAFFFKYCIKRKVMGRYDEWDGYCWGALFSGLIGFAMFIGVIFNIETIITGLINPEYGALKQIIEIIK